MTRLEQLRQLRADRIRMIADTASAGASSGGGMGRAEGSVSGGIGTADAMVKQVARLIRSTVVIGRHEVVALVLWILFTWVSSRCRVSPICWISAPQRRSGKTTTLEVASRFCRDSISACNATPAALFRLIETSSPTIFLDETDATLKGNEELRSILNSGHTRQSAYVLRIVNGETKKFTTWGPKLLCGIGQIDETLRDRSILIGLQRKRRSDTVVRLRDIPPGTIEGLVKQIRVWASNHSVQVETHRPASVPEQLNDREADNWEPLFAIADILGGEWPKWARESSVEISKKMASLVIDEQTELLQDIRNVFVMLRCDRISTRELISHLVEDEHLRWCDYNRGRPLNPRGMSDLLRQYRISPQTIRCGDQTMKGYYLDQFKRAFEAYLAPSP